MKTKQQSPYGHWRKPFPALDSSVEFLAQWTKETADILKSEMDRLDAKYYPERWDTYDADPTPWCHACGAKTKERCNCGPIADNN